MRYHTLLETMLRQVKGSGIQIVTSLAVFKTRGMRRDHVLSSRVGRNAAGEALAREYEGPSCCTFSTGWGRFRKDGGGSGVRVLVIESSLGQRGGRFGTHANDAHCQLVISGIEENVFFIYEPFAVEWKRMRNMIPQTVGKDLSRAARSLSFKLVCGSEAADGTCRARCAEFLARLAKDAKEAVSGAVVLRK